ncbi:MAG: PepSY domain-containing protein [Anaerolineae bacterium]|nr:PepSY domain-containing protein [Anaerolineae bacterium]
MTETADFKAALNPCRKIATRNKFYLATWRWHFYAGIFVIPFLIILSLTGLVMLYSDTIMAFQYPDQLFVVPSDHVVSAETQVEAVRNAYPGAVVNRYILPTAKNRSAQIAINTKDGQALTVFVNPYTAEVLGMLDESTTRYALANKVHGTLLLGAVGDHLIEIATGLAIMLVITGLYLWWPRNKQGIYGTLWPRFNKSKRILWRDLHASVGFYMSVGLLFFLISGMAWTGVWGTQIVQAWSSFPAQKWTDIPLSDQTHASLNHGELEEVPWNLEQTPLPASGSLAGTDGLPADVPVNLDTVIAYAKDNGFTTFRVDLPRSATGVYTVSADTMSGDITDARQDRTVHLDQYTGKKLADVRWSDYSLMAKSMAAGVALHNGNMGWLNMALNTLFCLATIFISVSSIIIWWVRRPKGVFRLVAPPMPKNMPLWKGAVLIMVLVSLAFPLVGITLLTVLVLDLVVISRVPVLKQLFN